MLKNLFDKAAKSRFWLWLTNWILWYKIPFNSPHAIKIVEIGTSSIGLLLPFKRRNRNHVNSMHACALATVCEYATGLQLGRFLNEKEFRIILSEIKMVYIKQARTNVTVSYTLPDSELTEIKRSLEQEPSVIRTLEADLLNTSGEVVCRGSVTWQIKKWKEVRIKK